jgi:hypothetical protein
LEGGRLGCALFADWHESHPLEWWAVVIGGRQPSMMQKPADFAQPLGVRGILAVAGQGDARVALKEQRRGLDRRCLGLVCPCHIDGGEESRTRVVAQSHAGRLDNVVAAREGASPVEP